MQLTKMGIYKLILVIGVLGVLDTIVLLLFKAGLNLGVLLPGTLGILFVLGGVLYLQSGYELFLIKNKRLRQLVIGLFAIWLLTFLVIEGIIITAAQASEDIDADYVIVLGAGLHGEVMSKSLTFRMEKALAYLQKHPKTRVIVSGGQGMGESITEAEAMQRFLVANEISKKRILKEERSTSTIENLRNSQVILQNEAVKNPKVMLVTNGFHMFRAKLLANRIGLDPYELPAGTPWTIRINSYIREYFALIKSYLIDK